MIDFETYSIDFELFIKSFHYIIRTVIALVRTQALPNTPSCGVSQVLTIKLVTPAHGLSVTS